jgi:hypothetical protein
MEKNREFEIKTNDLLASYISEFNEDVKLTYVNLREKSLMCSSIWAKWLSYLYKEKENLQRIAETKQKLLKKKMSNSKVTDSIIRQKNEDKLSETDDTMIKLNSLQKNTQTNVEYIERALNILQNFGFNVKNALDAYKLNFEH